MPASLRSRARPRFTPPRSATARTTLLPALESWKATSTRPPPAAQIDGENVDTWRPPYGSTWRFFTPGEAMKMSYSWCGFVAAESRLRQSVQAMNGFPLGPNAGSGESASSSWSAPSLVTRFSGPKLAPPSVESREKEPQS